LGTSDEAEAQRLVDQMNELLGNTSWWTIAACDKAKATFDDRIVRAFYDELTPAIRDSRSIRESVVPLPGRKEGYACVLFLGTTGAGKTTVVRQIIGTDPATERFPSISPAKTTICDHEVVPRPGPFQAVVTFLQKDQVRLYTEESVLEAILTVMENGTPEEAARRLLGHTEQRFRLSYILGTLPNDSGDGNSELSDEEGEGLFDEDAARGEVTPEERALLVEKLRGYLSAVESLGRIARKRWTELAEIFDISLEEASKQDRDELQEILEDELREREDFTQLIGQVLDDVETRFGLLATGTVVPDRTGWPAYWTFETEVRQEFIRTVNRFSSNYAPNFGRLLTPLVDGIRVAGPFNPEWDGESAPRLVLIDGEGLGQTPDSASSLSTEITKRYDSVDAILLVDNAAQPMQAAPCAVIKSLVTSGHESKLVLCFTHFDALEDAPNLPNRAARKNHLFSSIDNAVAWVGKNLGRSAENALKRLLPDRAFFLSRIQEPLKPSACFTRSELQRMTRVLASTIAPPVPLSVTPVYDDAHLILCVQKAMQEFREPWRARLGLSSHPDVERVHWARLKALTRRLGVLGEDEYLHLKPVADLIARLSAHISVFLETPLMWEPSGGADEMRRAAIASVERQVFTRLHEFAGKRLFLDRIKDWNVAYSHRGLGSTWQRAHDIENLYESAAPIPREIPDPDGNTFLREIRQLVREAIRAGGGRLVRLD
jgi:hypothetical protein